MRLAVVSFLAALVAAPLAAQAAQSSTRYSVTLRATVTDSFEYSRSGLQGRCRIRRTGSSGRQLAFASSRATRIQVGRGTQGATYRPSRLLTVRITGGSTGGSGTETKLCPGEPLETIKIDCNPKRAAPRTVRLGFRARRATIAFNRPVLRADVSVCGLDQPQPGGWLHIVAGPTNHDALIAGRSRRVFTRAGASEEETKGLGSSLEVTRKTTVRWTLTFRRIG